MEYSTLKNADFQETRFKSGDTELKFGVANGFRNIQNLVQKLKRGGKGCDFHFVEVMACPSGCLNGGAQARPETTGENAITQKELLAKYVPV